MQEYIQCSIQHHSEMPFPLLFFIYATNIQRGRNIHSESAKKLNFTVLYTYINVIPEATIFLNVCNISWLLPKV